MEVNKDLIKHVADVARLKLLDEEIEEFIPQFKEVLDSFSKLQEVDTEGLQPSFQPVELKNALREDEIKECFSQDDALKNTEHKKDGFFKGPKAV